MSGIYSDWTQCRYCTYDTSLDRIVCTLNYEPCEGEDCEMINNDW